MIPNHAQFITAIREKKMVHVRFYSIADNGVLERVCAPMDYGPGRENTDGLNRYWVWDSASTSGSPVLGLFPQQIVDLQMLGKVFDPAQFAVEPSPGPVSQPDCLPATGAVSTGSDISPKA